MEARTALGHAGEQLAAELYERMGFTVLDRNYRCRLGEIDIIAAKGSTLVFCEVKTRKTDRWGDPSEAVHPLKQQRLRRLAAEWLRVRGKGNWEVRFDVVSVILDGQTPQVTLIPDAF